MHYLPAAIGSSKPRAVTTGPAALLVAALLLGLAWLAPAYGQETKWYEVEVIVFAHETAMGMETEQWPESPDLPPLERAVELLPPSMGSIAPEDAIPQPFVELDPAEFRLAGVRDAMAQTNRYRVLLHKAWRQPVSENERAAAVHLHKYAAPRTAAQPTPGIEPEGSPIGTLGPGPSGQPPEPGDLDGIVRMRLGRYLHVDVDFVYRDERTAVSAPVATESPRFRLQESRRVRSGELHYFDHPRLGALVLLTPFDLPSDQTETTQTRPAR